MRIPMEKLRIVIAAMVCLAALAHAVPATGRKGSKGSAECMIRGKLVSLEQGTITVAREEKGQTIEAIYLLDPELAIPAGLRSGDEVAIRLEGKNGKVVLLVHLEKPAPDPSAKANSPSPPAPVRSR